MSKSTSYLAAFGAFRSAVVSQISTIVTVLAQSHQQMSPTTYRTLATGLSSVVDADKSLEALLIEDAEDIEGLEIEPLVTISNDEIEGLRSDLQSLRADVGDVAAARKEIDVLREELRSLRADVGEVDALRKEVRALKKTSGKSEKTEDVAPTDLLGGAAGQQQA